MDSETLERLKRGMEANRFGEKELAVISLSEGLGLVAEIERLRAEVEELSGKLSICEDFITRLRSTTDDIQT